MSLAGKSMELSCDVQAARYPNTLGLPPHEPQSVVQQWLTSFNNAIAYKDSVAIKSLFFEESFWKDRLTLTWDTRTLRGSKVITEFLQDQSYGLTPISLNVAKGTESEWALIDPHDKVKCLTTKLDLQTNLVVGHGILRLMQDESTSSWRCYTLYTAASDVKGHGESTRHNRPLKRPFCGSGGSRGYQNQVQTAEEPDALTCKVIVIGAGHCGLAIAARLKQLKIECLVIDAEERIGDNWRNRYPNLVLHDPVWYNHLPYLPFPEDWPVFTPKDDIADWLESYTKIMELKVSVNTSLSKAEWDGSQWCLTLDRMHVNGGRTSYTMKARHVIQATGQAGRLNAPDIVGMEFFRGTIHHSANLTCPPPIGKARSAVVIGSGNAAHDVAQAYHDNGWKVTMIQRSATTVDLARYEHGKGLYRKDGLSTRDADLLTQSLPNALLKKTQIEATKQMRHDNRALFAKLEARGFRLDWGPDGSGRKLQYLMRGGGYYIDTGTSSLIASGAIRVVSDHHVSRILPQGLILSSNTVQSSGKTPEVLVPAEQIILCTGHWPMSDTTRQLFGDRIADRVGPVWGLDSEGELRRVWRPTGVKGLWIVGGNFKAARWGIETLGVLIDALELGVCQWQDLVGN